MAIMNVAHNIIGDSIMGSFFGVAFIDNTKKLGENELRDKLNTIPKASNAIKFPIEMRTSLAARLQANYMNNKNEIDNSFEEEKARYNEMEASGILNRIRKPPASSMEEMLASISSMIISGQSYEPKAFFSDTSKWFCISNDDTMNVGDRSASLETAKRYALHFDLPVLVMAVCDSDAAYIGYCDSKTNTAKSYKHGFDESSQKNSSLPKVLMGYIEEDNHLIFANIWKDNYVCQEDLLRDIAILLDINPDFIERNEYISTPAGYKLMEL